MRGLDFRRDRRRTTALTAMLVIAGLGWSAAGPSPAAAAFGISLDSIVGGLESPTQITNAGDGTDRLFVVEQRGTVRVIQGGVLQPGFFLDIRSKVEDGGERGLLGLAFSPNFETNRQLFVFYTRNGGDIVVTRFTTNAPRTNADESTHRPLFLIEHSAQTNHNGGGLTFGPDGLLYIAVGDGGGSGDPRNNAQRKTTLLGKILRVNVNGTKSGPFHHYSNPAANPFKGSTPGLDEIWAYGLRNPWRISFDRVTGQLFIGDVGQGRWEEIDREKPGIRGGRNYGWDAMEGFHCYTASKCPLSGDTLPVAEYSHSGGNCSITGGFVYRGPTQTELIGQYVFADYCSGRIWTMPNTSGVMTLRADTSHNITSFGESENGELYAVTSSGTVYRVLTN